MCVCGGVVYFPNSGNSRLSSMALGLQILMASKVLRWTEHLPNTRKGSHSMPLKGPETINMINFYRVNNIDGKAGGEFGTFLLPNHIPSGMNGHDRFPLTIPNM